MAGKLDGKIALVTGAASGIGRASALRFAQEGARVLAFDRSEEVAQTADLIRAAGGEGRAMQGDAGADADVRAALDRAEDAFGGIDLIFANAGISGGLTGLFEQTAEDWAAVLHVNLIGPFLAIKHGGPRLVARGGGAIVCTASVAGLRAGAGGPAYSASKAGVINLVQVAAQQLSGSGVRVNAICPGLIETGMTRFAFDIARAKGRGESMGALNPLRRAGAPEEIAGAALFLASDEASYVNGHALVVDGGLSTTHPFTRPPQLGKTFT